MQELWNTTSLEWWYMRKINTIWEVLKVNSTAHTTIKAIVVTNDAINLLTSILVLLYGLVNNCLIVPLLNSSDNIESDIVVG